MRILATSGGLRPTRQMTSEIGPLLRHALELSGAERPRVTFLTTATGDQTEGVVRMSDAFARAGITAAHLRLFPMPNVADPEAMLLGSDVVWVGGGSVANLLAVWRAHGLDAVFRRAWEAGVVLGGVSAGSICWHAGGTTDSFGPDLRAVTDGLGLLPHANGVHYDSEEQRRPLLHRLVGDGTLPDAYATDDGVGLVYEGTTLVEAVSDIAGKAAYAIRRTPDGVTEERIEPRLLL